MTTEVIIGQEYDPIPCFFCGKNATTGCSFNNKENQVFVYIPKHSSAHLECYIDECVRFSFEKHLLKNKIVLGVSNNDLPN